MKNKLFLSIVATFASSAAFAADAAARTRSTVSGVLVLLLVVAGAYLFVFLTRGGVDRKHSNPMDFDKFTTPSDRPSIERY